MFSFADVHLWPYALHPNPVNIFNFVDSITSNSHPTEIHTHHLTVFVIIFFSTVSFSHVFSLICTCQRYFHTRLCSVLTFDLSHSYSPCISRSRIHVLTIGYTDTHTHTHIRTRERNKTRTSSVF